jgi:hypothetical protein
MAAGLRPASRMEMWSRMNDLTMDEAMKFEDYDAKIYIKQHPIFALERK